MSQQKKNKTVALAAIVAVVMAVSAGFVLVIPHLQTVAASSSHNYTTSTSNGNHISDSVGSSSIGHVGMMRTINNTHCVSSPGGPQIC
jgi:hypothetical protein